MDSIKLKFRASTKSDKEGQLFFQIIHDRAIRRVSTGHRIFAEEWDEKTESICLPVASSGRYSYLRAVRQHCSWELERFKAVVSTFQNQVYSVDDLATAFQGETGNGTSLFGFMRRQSERLKGLGRDRCSETMFYALRSFMQFRGGIDIGIDRLTREMIVQYEAWMLGRGLKRNTTSYYMRNLRVAYKAAVDEGLTTSNDIFCKVYMGVDKTIKRAISIEDVRQIKRLELGGRPALEFARDMLMLCFYLRGISFVDLSYLRKADVQGGRVQYIRKKTKQQLSIQMPPEAEAIVSKYQSNTQYLLPIITTEDGTERKQYQRKLMSINRHLKKVGELAGLSNSLSTYVMRHSWATIARDKGIELSVISKALGHENELTTQIYLDSISTAKVDKANRAILDDLR